MPATVPWQKKVERLANAVNTNKQDARAVAVVGGF